MTHPRCYPAYLPFQAVHSGGAGEQRDWGCDPGAAPALQHLNGLEAKDVLVSTITCLDTYAINAISPQSVK